MANRKLNKSDRIWEWTVLDASRRIRGETRSDGTIRTYAAALVECSCSAPEKQVRRVIYQHHLRSGNTKSCGHLGREMARERIKDIHRARKHHVKARLRINVAPEQQHDRAVIRRIWKGIKDRCLNPDNTAYPNYGGRGIALWELWREDSEAFITWVLENLGPRPANPPGWTSNRSCWSIDRIDVNGNYEPVNLKWSTQAGQMANTRAQLDPMNGIVQTPKAGTFGFCVHRDKEKFAEYGFATREDAAQGRDEVLSVLEAHGPGVARELVRGRTSAREAARNQAAESARREAQDKQDAARKAKEDAARAGKEALGLERQAKREARQDRKMSRAQRWHEMNKTMTLSEIARAEAVSVANVSTTLRDAGLPVVLHNGLGFVGVKKVTKGKRTYYEARMVIDGRRKTLGQRKTPEEAHELYVAARNAKLAELPYTPVPATSDSGIEAGSGKPKRRTVKVRAA